MKLVSVKQNPLPQNLLCLTKNKILPVPRMVSAPSEPQWWNLQDQWWSPGFLSATSRTYNVYKFQGSRTLKSSRKPNQWIQGLFIRFCPLKSVFTNKKLYYYLQEIRFNRKKLIYTCWPSTATGSTVTLISPFGPYVPSIGCPAVPPVVVSVGSPSTYVTVPRVVPPSPPPWHV